MAVTSARWRFATHSAAGVNAPGYNHPTSNAKSGLKRLNPVSARNTGLKSGVTETARDLHEHGSPIEV